MKKSNYLKILCAAAAISFSGAAFAEPVADPDLKDILSAGSGAIGNLVEGVFTKSDLTVADIAGTWTSTGSAVTFQSDNFLMKAGGSAAAGAVEEKLDPYFSKFGLTGAVLDIDKDGNFTLTIKKMPIKGTLEVKSKGVFTFKFLMGLGSMDAYVEKSPTNLNVMFDADKIKKIMTFAAKLSKSKMVSAADKVLEQYDGVCIGFKMKGQAAASGDSTTGNSTTDAAVNALKDLLGK